MSFKKNTAVTGFTIGLVSASDGSDITTGTPVGYYTLDGGTQTAIADVSPTHEGNGQWSFDLTAGEMNGDIVGLTFTHASAITQHFTIKTDTKIVSELQDLTAAQINTECDTAISDAALATAANLAIVDTNVDAILVDTAEIGVAGAGLTNIGTIATVTNLTNLPTIPANWITAAGINAGALNGKGDWNVGKTGYTLTQTFPANFSDLSITSTTGLVNLSDKTGFSISGTITTLDGLNNFDPATDAVANVTLVDTTTTNTDMRGTDGANTTAPDNASITAILTDTGTTLPASIAALPTATEINAEIVDVLETDTHAEPASGVSATATIKDSIMYIKTMHRNKMTQTATTTLLRNDADNATIATSTVSDDGTTTTRGKFI